MLHFSFQRIDEEEWLDLGYGTPEEVKKSLNDINRINIYLGGNRLFRKVFLPFFPPKADPLLVENSHLTTYSILDVGTGSADVLHYFHNSFKINSEQFKLTGLDINPRHLNYAKSKLNHSKISLVQADAFKLPFADKSFDFVISSLFLHHFNPEQIKKMLPEFLRVSKNAIIMNDLIRDYVPLIFFKLTQLIFARSYLTRHDGTASVRRSYTVKEMKEVVSSLGIKNFEIKEYFPEYRMILMITPDA